MLTPTQQNFKNKMSKLNRDGYDFGEGSIYRPIKRNRSKRPWWTFSFIGIILFLLVFSNIPIKIYHDFIWYRDGKINEYLSISKHYDTHSGEILTNLVGQSSGLSYPNLSDIEMGKSTVHDLIVEAEKAKAPSTFEEYHETLIEVMRQRLFILSYLEVLANIGSPSNGDLDLYFTELSAQQQQNRYALMAAFEQADIDFTIQTDGSIQYQFRAYY